ncbi:MAG: ATP synthase F1 subunit epsilon [Clostridia bacterium]|nr:ATP synthase F1 subunit epsilon [Clostridia bacterium]
MATFHLQIVTPDRKAYDAQAERIILRTVTGDVCILSRHIDYVAPLGIGEARVTDEKGNMRRAACAGGMVSVANNVVRVMATTFEWEDEIDLERARAAQEKAQQKLLQMNRDDVKYVVMEAKLKRALNRIQIKG